MPGDNRLLPPNLITVDEGGKSRLASKNLTPGTQVYGERLITVDGLEYRLWSPHRSKLAAMLEKGMTVPVQIASRVLYLGGATGTTASHVSDMVSEGRVYVVEFSHRAMSDLVTVCAGRKNLVPILGDAARPQTYRAIVEQVDLIYQDVAQPNQAEIALANARQFLGPGGYLILVIKARSVDSTANPKQVYEQEVQVLEQEFDVLEAGELKPFHQDHLAVIAQRKQDTVPFSSYFQDADSRRRAELSSYSPAGENPA